MKKFVAIFAVLLGVSSISQAGILVEPYVGYEMGKTENPDGKLEGTQAGLRLAWKSPVMLWLGVDGTFGVSGKAKPDNFPETDVTRTTIYAVAGVDLPILLRGWVGYGFSDELKFDSGTEKGTSTKIGVGFTGLPFVSLNLEYVTEKIDSNNLDLKNNAYVLSVSLPLSF